MFLVILVVVFVAVGIYLRSPSAKGRRSEQAVALKLDIDSRWKANGKVLTNIYVPKASGDTVEIDVLYITKKGLIVLENKNYAGYIFGSDSNKNWTVTLYAGKTWYGGNKVDKFQFYNPVWQNRSHIKYLKEYLKTDIKAFSLITFSNRGELKEITVNSPDVYVCEHNELSGVLKEIWNNNPDVLSDTEIEKIYEKLLPLTDVNKEEKQRHIEGIQDRFSSTDICPVCGGKLVVRTARRGSNAGNQFYGCSNYPKCKYIRDL